MMPTYSQANTMCLTYTQPCPYGPDTLRQAHTHDANIHSDIHMMLDIHTWRHTLRQIYMVLDIHSDIHMPDIHTHAGMYTFSTYTQTEIHAV